MTESGASNEDVEASPRALATPGDRRQARAAAVWNTFTYVAVVVAALYAVFTVSHFLFLDPAIRLIMMGTAATSCLICLATFVYLKQRPVRHALAHPLALLITAIITLNSGMHLYLSGEPNETTNFVLVLLGCGIFYYSTRWLLLALTLILGTWLGISGTIEQGNDGVHLAFFVFEISVLSLLVHTIRMRSFDRLLDTQFANDFQRQQLTDAVQEKARAEERLRRLSEATFEAVFLHRNGTIVDTNEQATQLFGYTREEFLNTSMDELLAPEVRERSPFGRKTLHSSTGSERDGKIHESIALHKNGHRFTIEFGALKDRPDALGIDATAVRDITARRQLENRMRDFVENAVDYIYETDAKGNYTYVNAATQRLLSTGDTLIGKNCIDFIHPADVRRVQTQLAAQDFSAQPRLYQEFRICVHHDDMERWIGQNVQPIFTGDTPTGYRIVGRNITDRVMAIRQALTARRQAEEANRSKSRFLSSMSHELRTPLNGILGFTQLLLEEVHGPLNPAQYEDLVNVSGCSNHLLNLIEDLLDLSKADIDAINLHLQPMSVNQIVDSAAAMVQASADEKSVELAFRIPEGLGVEVDERRARQILINLLSNAVKFSPPNARVDISAHRTHEGMIELHVSDRGPGIPEAHQTQVFSEFFQSDLVRDANLGGSGIGLALVKKLVHLHGGAVGYQDRKGGGSVFWFTLQSTEAELPAVTDRPPSNGRPHHPCSGRILVVDDVDTNVFLIENALSPRGYTVAVARNGEEAVELTSEFKPDLILMDMHMPVMDGFEATTKVRNLPGFERTPIIALTASVNEFAITDCIAAGCNEHLGKPVQLETLYERVAHYCTPAPPPRMGHQAVAPPTGSSLRILVADDTERNQSFMAAFFKHLPDTVTFVGDGLEAVERVRQEEFDVVLMDVRMPRMNGLDATRTIREEKDAKRLPIVGLSGLDDQDDIQACLKAGMNDFLTKPIRFARLLEALELYRQPVPPEASGPGESPDHATPE